ncbi:MAG: MBOAT family O-acyltransferase [Proteocatella sp.]
MLFSIIANYTFGLLISTPKYSTTDEQSSKQHKSASVFFIAIIFNIFILGFFKYYGFFIDNINNIFKLSLEYRQLALPIGISFYTFQVLSYIIDVYKEKVSVQQNPISFALYVTMFPQLIAGPIVKYTDIETQLENRIVTMSTFGEGSSRFIQGLGKKVLLANNIGPLWTAVQALDIGSISVLSAWLGILAFTFQIYFDFSGYSDMAIGLGKMFGFDFMENFNHPYSSTSITDFWRRWHISLGTWFREYVYIPLGGNRCNFMLQFRNIFVVWLLTGLWHGASWNFVIWGLYYGFILFLEKLFLKKFIDSLPSFMSHVYCMLIVITGWVFFAVEDIVYAKNFICVMFGFGNNPVIDSASIYYMTSYGLLFLMLALLSSPLFSKSFSTEIKLRDFFKANFRTNFGIILHIAILIVSTAYLVTETYNPFLYFRF